MDVVYKYRKYFCFLNNFIPTDRCELVIGRLRSYNLWSRLEIQVMKARENVKE